MDIEDIDTNLELQYGRVVFGQRVQNAFPSHFTPRLIGKPERSRLSPRPRSSDDFRFPGESLAYCKFQFMPVFPLGFLRGKSALPSLNPYSMIFKDKDTTSL